MNEIRRYEVRGTAALAYRESRNGEGALIDYDIARRSYEARQRLAKRQAAAGRPIVQRPTLRETVRDSYTPNQGMAESIGAAGRRIAEAISGHPMCQQLKHGSLAGRETGKATYHQVFTSASVGMVLAAVLVFVGV